MYIGPSGNAEREASMRWHKFYARLPHFCIECGVLFWLVLGERRYFSFSGYCGILYRCARVTCEWNA